jgi:hypothetical protein
MDGIVAVAAEQGIVAEAADQRVVAGAAVEGELHRGCRQLGGIDDIVADEAVDDQRVEGVGVIDRHRRERACDRDGGADERDIDLVVRIGAVD